MYTYYIKNIKTGKEDNISGHSFDRACKANNLDPMEWEVQMMIYED